MGQERKIGDCLADLESALHEIAPVPARLDTAQTLFLAGQQSICNRHNQWQTFWPLSSACLAVVCITLGVLLARPTKPQIVYVPSVRSTEIVVDKDEADRTEPEAPVNHDLASVATDAQWRDLLELRRWQAQVLDGSLDRADVETASGEPVIIKLVRYSDWPRFLTEADRAERCPETTTPRFFDWKTLFSTRGS